MDDRLEERYVVVKLKGLDEDQVANLWCTLWDNNIQTTDCVVVESDWGCYKRVVDIVLGEEV
jgi:hypothetical protein